MTLQEKVEGLIGSISDTDSLSVWLTTGAKIFIDVLPEEKAELYATSQDDSGNGVAVTSKRILKAYKGGYGARRVDSGLQTMVVDSDSIHYATSDSPVSYIYNGKLYIKPDGGNVLTIAYPTVAYNDSAITGIPDELYQGVVVYASIQAVSQNLNTSISNLKAGGYTKVADLSLDYTNTDTALTDEDIDVSRGNLEKLRTQMENFQMDMYNELNESNSKVQLEAGAIRAYADLLSRLYEEYKELLQLARQ